MTRVHKRAVMLTLLWCMSSVASAADTSEEARKWLERMSSAMNQMSYQGTFVYMRGLNFESMRITHVVSDEGVRERLYSFNGPQREVIRDKNGVRCVLGDRKAVMEDPFVAGVIFPIISLDGLMVEDTPYILETSGRTRLAGHFARRVSIKAVDRYRYGYELWLEENTGLLLKWALYDGGVKPIARLMFTELNLGDDILLEELESDTPASEFVVIKSEMPTRSAFRKSDPQWKPDSVPKGFNLAAHNMVEKEGKSVFEHLVYSDGLASVSVYIEEKTGKLSDIHGESMLGTANAYTRDIGSKHVTVIGEVPSVTVKSIGEAVNPPVAAE